MSLKINPFKNYILLFICCLIIISSQLQAQHHAQWFIDSIPSGYFTKSASVGDGTFILATNYRAGLDSELLIFRSDQCGNIYWAKKWNSPHARHGRINNLQVFGNEIFISTSLGPLLPDSTAAITKMSLQGKHLWSKTYRTGDWEFWFNLDINRRGEIFLAGHNNSNTHNDNQVVKLNYQGDVIWSNSYTQSGVWGWGTSTSDGGYLKLSGKTIFKLAEDGSPDWIFDYHLMSWPYDAAPIEVKDGFLIPCRQNRFDYGMSVIKIDFNGNLLWASKVADSTYVQNLTTDEKGNIYLYGRKNFQRENWLINFSPNGKTQSALALSRGGESDGINFYNGHIHLFQRVYLSGNYGMQISKVPTRLPDSGACVPPAINTSQFLDNDIKRVPSAFNATPLPYPLSVEYLEVNLQDWTASSQLLCENLNAIPDSVDLGPDTAFCPQGSIRLGVKNGVLGEYLWSTGAKTPTITIKTPGVYWLEVNAGCGQKIMRDSIQIDEYRLKKLDFTLDGQPSVLDTVTVGLKSSGFLQATWYMNDTLLGVGKDLRWRFSRPGAHIVKACYTSPDLCISCDSLRLIVPEEKLHLPNAFSPNGDGLNDYFGPAERAVHSYQLTLFARTGQEIKSLKNQPWDGKHKGLLMNQGVYLYRLTYQFHKGDRERILNGHVTILQ